MRRSARQELEDCQVQLRRFTVGFGRRVTSVPHPHPVTTSSSWHLHVWAAKHHPYPYEPPSPGTPQAEVESRAASVKWLIRETSTCVKNIVRLQGQLQEVTESDLVSKFEVGT